MGLFKKKSDPISERAKALNAEIAALEAKIKKLNTPPPAQGSPLPKVRSTALPHGPTVPATPPLPNLREPIFEEVDQAKLKAPETVAPEQFNQLGVKKYDLFGFFRRFKNNFRSRPAANARLVSYLAAGSIQGLRPLRYEKRVARNRFIVLAIFLLLVSWGIIAMVLRHR